MSTGVPQDQQDLRWPYTEDGDDQPVAAPARQEHPSGPLPVGRDRSASSRGWGRGRGRDAAAEPEPEGDADYDWIRYLGAAGPAQETARRADARPSRRATPPSGGGQSGPSPESWRTAPARGNDGRADPWRTAPARGDDGDPWETTPPRRATGAGPTDSARAVTPREVAPRDVPRRDAPLRDEPRRAEGRRIDPRASATARRRPIPVWSGRGRPRRPVPRRRLGPSLWPGPGCRHDLTTQASLSCRRARAQGVRRSLPVPASPDRSGRQTPAGRRGWMRPPCATRGLPGSSLTTPAWPASDRRSSQLGFGPRARQARRGPPGQRLTLRKRTRRRAGGPSARRQTPGHLG
jgi:hypothetical protein